MPGHAIGLKHARNFRHFFFWNFLDLAIFASALLFVVFGVTASREITAQAHRDRSGRDLRQSPNHNQPRILYRARKSRGQGERHGQAVSHSDDYIANKISSHEVRLDMFRVCHAQTSE